MHPTPDISQREQLGQKVIEMQLRCKAWLQSGGGGGNEKFSTHNKIFEKSSIVLQQTGTFTFDVI